MTTESTAAAATTTKTNLGFREQIKHAIWDHQLQSLVLQLCNWPGNKNQNAVINTNSFLWGEWVLMYDEIHTWTHWKAAN